MSWLPSDELAQARNDPAFGSSSWRETLSRLLEALKIMHHAKSQDPKTERQIKEGVDLAVKLADRLHKSGDRGN